MLVSHSISLALGGSKMVVGGGGGLRGKQKKVLVACKEVRIYWMLERCGGGRDHADEEKCQTVLDQADQRHFGTKITEFPAGVNTLKMI